MSRKIRIELIIFCMIFGNCFGQELLNSTTIKVVPSISVKDENRKPSFPIYKQCECYIENSEDMISLVEVFFCNFQRYKRYINEANSLPKYERVNTIEIIVFTNKKDYNLNLKNVKLFKKRLSCISRELLDSIKISLVFESNGFSNKNVYMAIINSSRKALYPNCNYENWIRINNENLRVKTIFDGGKLSK